MGIDDPHFPVKDPRHSYTTSVVQGSNPHLKPQQAYSYFLEAVWTPDSKNDFNGWFHWLHGLTAYIDWFQIVLRNTLDTIPIEFVLEAPPCPQCPQWGLRPTQSFPLPNLSRAVLVVRCAAGPLRASPASASLLRDLLTAVTPSKRSLTFAFVSLFARSSLQ